jgi:hypothetical protein
MRTLERLGTDKPHQPAPVKEEKKEEDEGAKRPLSPTETGTEETQQTIDVKPDEPTDNVLVKRPEEEEEESPATPDTPQPTTASDASGKGTIGRRGRPKKKLNGVESNAKPYEGLFEATVKTDTTPPTMEIRDLRQNVTGGETTWTEPIHCLVCNTQLS